MEKQDNYAVAKLSNPKYAKNQKQKDNTNKS